MPVSYRPSLLLLALLLPGSATLSAQQKSLDLTKLELRNLGPATMGGRVIDLAVHPKRLSTFYVASASGGLWKTENRGTTFEPLFQHEETVSIGSIAIAPSAPMQIWVGTGEANNRNSTSWGNGVYLSKDGGKTWTHKGLPKSFHVGRIAVHPTNPNVVFVAACGYLWGPNPERGLYRTTDGGDNWELVLEGDERTGATEVRIDPSNPDIVYAALYERQRDAFDGNHPAKRWGPGSGLYRSDDGGTTWRKLTKGLPTCNMGRISLDIYAKNPSIVYALIETEKIGTRPEGAPPRQEQPAGGASLGVTVEEAVGGVKLREITEGSPAQNAGLKAGDLLLEIGGESTADQGDLNAALENKRGGERVEVMVLREASVKKLPVTLGGRPGQPFGRRRRSLVADRIGGQQANVVHLQGPKGFETGGLYRTTDRGQTWERINSINPRPYYFSQIRVDPSDNNYIYICGISFRMSTNGGKTFRGGNSAPGVHVDHHALWVNPSDGRNLILGCDGGVNMTWDRCKTWEVFENLDIGQCYHADADTRRPYWVYAGYQDNGSWGGPSATRWSEGIMNTDWFKVGGGDGFVCRIDPDDPNIVFSESQGGRIGWRNVMVSGRGGRVASPRARQLRAADERWAEMSGRLRTRTETRTRSGEVRTNEVPTRPGAEVAEASQERQDRRARQGGSEAQQGRQGEAAGRGQGRRFGGRGPQGRQAGPRLRGNWNTPFLLSAFNSKTIYFAGNYVCKSTDRGRNTQVISGRISLTDHRTGGTGTALAESPRQPGVLYVGTDDGAFWVTKNDGADWTPLHEKLVALRGEGAKPIWVNNVCASQHSDGRAYVALDGHRVGERRPNVFVTEDFGDTWKSISAGLPENGSSRVVYEDSKNPDLLYVGTEMALFISLDRGQTWQRLPKPFPTVAVHDFDLQEREQHLIIATHGRSIWTLDVRPLRELTKANLEKDTLLVKPRDVLRLRRRGRGKQGHRHFRVPNPPERAIFYYYLKEGVNDPVTVEVSDILGKVVWTGKGKQEAGLQRVDWNLRVQSRGPAQRGAGRMARFFGRRGRGVPEGSYTVTLKVGDEALVQSFRIEDDKTPLDVSWPRPPAVGEGMPPPGGGQELDESELEEEEEADESGTGKSGAGKSGKGNEKKKEVF